MSNGALLPLDAMVQEKGDAVVAVVEASINERRAMTAQPRDNAAVGTTDARQQSPSSPAEIADKAKEAKQQLEDLARDGEALLQHERDEAQFAFAWKAVQTRGSTQARRTCLEMAGEDAESGA